MDYSLHQRGRASIDFLSDLRGLSDKFEARTDQRAREAGLDPQQLPADPEELQAQVAPVLEADPEFRVLPGRDGRIRRNSCRYRRSA